jgi:16S rRNA (adenine1518-N6/adenine1519-N6)-dimethyltransferase
MKKTRRHALGQHFLINRGVLRKIIRTISPRADELIIEIGPGKGALTIPLAQEAGKVIAIEKDKNLAADLQGMRIPHLTVVENDVLKVDFRKMLEQEKAFENRVKLVGNLPYSISTPLLFRVLKDRDLFPLAVFLVQKEVAERFCAGPGSKRYAPLSLLFQISFVVRLHFLVSPGSFSPPPKVESAVLSLQRRSEPLFEVGDEPRFQKFLRTAFAHRRKLLIKNLESGPYSPSRLTEAYERIGLPRTARPEELTIAQFVDLFTFLLAGDTGSIA